MLSMSINVDDIIVDGQVQRRIRSIKGILPADRLPYDYIEIGPCVYKENDYLVVKRSYNEDKFKRGQILTSEEFYDLCCMIAASGERLHQIKRIKRLESRPRKIGYTRFST